MKFTGVNDVEMVEAIQVIHQMFKNVWVKRSVNKEFLDEIKIFEKLEQDLTVKLSKRLKVSAGQAWYKRNTIDLSYDLHRDNPRQLMYTYGHELAHLLSFRLYGKDCGHGLLWKYVMKELDLPPERCHDMDVSSYRRAKVRYEYECGNCGKEYKLTAYKHRNSHRYTCKACGPVNGYLSLIDDEPVRI